MRGKGRLMCSWKRRHLSMVALLLPCRRSRHRGNDPNDADHHEGGDVMNQLSACAVPPAHMQVRCRQGSLDPIKRSEVHECCDGSSHVCACHVVASPWSSWRRGWPRLSCLPCRLPDHRRHHPPSCCSSYLPCLRLQAGQGWVLLSSSARWHVPLTACMRKSMPAKLLSDA